MLASPSVGPDQLSLFALVQASSLWANTFIAAAVNFGSRGLCASYALRSSESTMGWL